MITLFNGLDYDILGQTLKHKSKGYNYELFYFSFNQKYVDSLKSKRWAQKKRKLLSGWIKKIQEC